MKPRTWPESSRLAGIVTTAELVASGWQPDQIRVSAKRGDLVAVRRGVYADGQQARKLAATKDGDRLLAVAAAAALARRDAVVSHQSAAFLHHIATIGRVETVVHMTRPAGAGWQGPAGVRLHAALLPAGHVTTVAGLRATTPARTAVDLARVLPFRAGVVVADSALHQRLATKDALLEVLGSCARWPGTRTAAEVVAFADRRSESPLESLARVVFRDCGLPPPQLQALVGDRDDVARVDFYWPQFRTIAEVDGALKYTPDARVTAQLERDSWLRALGYEVVHFTWTDITTVPELVASRIRRAFRRGELLAVAHSRA